MAEKNFRKDINGLRAIAVLSVLVFHFSPSFLPGGFAGVDVFFVISGFLMTSIIFRGVENNNFSIVKFLIARCKRIVPALVAVVVTLLIVGYLIFEPLTYQAIGKHSFSSLLFISNFTYFFESGYFDADSRSKFLLHTWSLSVEWQFYIIYPIIVYALSKILSLSKIKIAVVVAAIISLSLSVYVSYTDPSAAYFMLYTRAWEMIVGGLAFLYPLTRYKEHSGKIEIAGIALIAVSIALISDKTPWPGYAALLPVVGAYFVILADNKKSILSNVILQKAGLWSYSIYLAHWPAIVILGKFNIDVSFLTYLYIVLAISIILYYTVEKRRNYGIGLCCMFVIAIYASYYVSENGVKSRVDEKFGLTAKEFHAKYYGGVGFKHEGTAEKIGDEKPAFILFGDSYARQYLRFLKENGYSFISIMKDGCYYFGNYINHSSTWGDNACRKRYNTLVDIMASNPGIPVVISLSWLDYDGNISSGNNQKKITGSDYKNMVLSDLSRLTNDNRDFAIIGSNFQTRGNIAFECLARKSMMPPLFRDMFSNCESQETIIPVQINNDLKKFTNGKSNVEFIDPNEYLCNEGKCSIVTKGEPVLSDGTHLSYYGTLVAGNGMFKRFRER